MTKSTLTLSTIILLISVSGCSSSSANDPIALSQQGNTVKQNYEAHMSGSNTTGSSGDVYLYRPVGNEVSTSRIHNPDLKMFVYPRRSGSVMMPAYQFEFPMYKQVHYDYSYEVQ
ncbi:hypothetical protein KW507_15890 [Vibrio fluvialis]|nr:hypothetical protein [Vibrio fluvialis]